MHVFVTKKKRSKMLKESLENMVKWADERLDAGDLDLDNNAYISKYAAQDLLDIWFKEEG